MRPISHFLRIKMGIFFKQMVLGKNLLFLLLFLMLIFLTTKMQILFGLTSRELKNLLHRLNSTSLLDLFINQLKGIAISLHLFAGVLLVLTVEFKACGNATHLMVAYSPMAHGL